MSEALPLLSIVIRNRNEGAFLEQVFAALRIQIVPFVYEIILVDNESEDYSCELAKTNQAQVVSIPKSEFTYGRALNWGIAHARGQLVLTLSAHILPVGRHFLQDSVVPFTDPLVAAARCLATSDAQNLVQWYQPKVIHYDNPAEQRQAETDTGWLKTYPTAACSVIRKTVWDEVKYDETLEAVEDKEWASRVLARGYKIVNSVECVFYYLKTFNEISLVKKQQRELLALYRIKRQVPLTRKWFLIRMAKAIYEAPGVAFRHVHQQFLKNYYLVSISSRAKQSYSQGSLPEFEREKNVRH
jgi:rhamnosyltransferase